MLKTYRKTSGNDGTIVKAEQLNLNEKVEDTLKRYPELEFGIVDVKPYPDGPFEVLGFRLGNEVVTKSVWFVTDIKGKHYLVSNEDFKKDYEEME
ncbi:hypothetical protein FM124_05630 [Pediococcus acidilactici]|uniref:hypothetical protein n=1 Tax=Pediococcus acidilactici TaxID=1254 RepID=UPI00097E8DCE|nr:hypothetical protein [Pediococcus acidilactici]SJM48761.1 hypothetical protein FM124_05630 [Pediococcus acidilactici]